MKGLIIIVFICSASMAIPVKETKTDVKRIPSTVSTGNQKVPVKVKRSPTFGGGFSNAASFSLNTGWGGFGGSSSSSLASGSAGLAGSSALSSAVANGFGGPGVSAGFSGSSALSSAGANGYGGLGDYWGSVGYEGPYVPAGSLGSSALSSAGATGYGVSGGFGSPLGFGVSSSQAQSSSGGFGWRW